ncbi:LysR family transcriptional regulator [Stenotrophomonas rhizophila]
MDTLRCMQAFVAVVEHGSFNAAAEHVAVSSVMVGKYIQQLETHLGVRLLQRNTRRQSLTDAGRNYLAGCRSVLEQVQQANASVAGLQAQPRGCCGSARRSPGVAACWPRWWPSTWPPTRR